MTEDLHTPKGGDLQLKVVAAKFSALLATAIAFRGVEARALHKVSALPNPFIQNIFAVFPVFIDRRYVLVPSILSS
jgi:hypothetical protein